METGTYDDRRERRLSLPARSAAAAASDTTPGPDGLKAVIDAMPEAVLLTDADDRILVVNPAANRLFAGRPVRDRADLLARFEPLPQGAEPEATPIVLRPRDQPNHWFELRAIPLPHDQDRSKGGASAAGTVAETPPATSVDRSAMFVLRDITAARESRAEREAVLSIMSHELRTPITTIYAGSSVLARNHALTPSVSSHLAADISAEAARLYDLVEDLLVVVRSERRVLDPLHEPVSLQRAVDSAVRIAAERHPEVPIIRAGASDPAPVDADSTYLEHATRNLVLAAARFSGTGAPVVVRLDSDDAARETSLRVLDRGPSLDADDAARLFDLSEDDPASPRPGIGIAAYAARRLIEAMGGRVWARPREGGGAELGFALPQDVDAR